MTRLTNNLMSEISSYHVLDTAYAWLQANRLNSHPNNPFWSLSLNWPSIRESLRIQLQVGNCQFNQYSITATKWWDR